uniref:CD45 n=1 Tax=Angiostrongylus cantonensis TaxID=6313 RepID=A0A0K0D676_ANGCA
ASTGDKLKIPCSARGASQFFFQKGRNIVPVRLFFETDPVLLTTGTNQNESFITSAGSSNISEDLGADEKEAPEMDSSLARNKSEDNSEKSIIRTTSMKLEHVINTAFVDEDQVFLSDNAEFQPEDLNGSGMRPLTTESMEETHTKLLPEEEKDLFDHQIREIKPIEKHLMTTILTPSSLISVTSTTTPEIEKSLDMSASEGIANKNATLKGGFFKPFV